MMSDATMQNIYVTSAITFLSFDWMCVLLNGIPF